MKIILSTFSIVAIFVGSLFDNNYLVRPQVIVWSDSVKLSWGYFCGFNLPGKKPQIQTELHSWERIAFHAVINTNIICSRENNVYDIQAVFYPGRSFYEIHSDTLKPTSYSLRHELYHFHLAELFARYIRRDLELLREPSSQQVDSLCTRYTTELDSAHAAYDKFTRHANIIANQKLAERSIDSLLLTMVNYRRSSRTK